MGVLVTTPWIEVVMPVFNGELYLEDQIASIYSQTLTPRRLLIRDDGSTDSSFELLVKLKSTYGDWLYLFPKGSNLGCTKNINLLLEETTAPYISLSDQDDVWLPDKLEISFKHLKKIEEIYGQNMPALIHTDLRLVDSSLSDMGLNYTSKQLINPLLTSPSSLCLTNVVTGCTILCNRLLLERALPIPEQALVHDWWIALVASVFGRIHFIPISTILYRQHQHNAIGAKGLGWTYWYRRFIDFRLKPHQGGHTSRVVKQIQAFESRYGIKISCLPDIITLPPFLRIIFLYRLRFSFWPLKHGPLRTLALYIWLFRLNYTSI